MDSLYLKKTLISLSLTARREACEAREAARAATDTQTAMIASTEEATAEGRLDAYKEVADAIGIDLDDLLDACLKRRASDV